MSYVDGTRSPRPSPTELAFASLTDQEREAMTEQWLRDVGLPRSASNYAAKVKQIETDNTRTEV